MRAYLFGPLRLEDGENRPISLPPTSHGRTLLAWLLLHADQLHGRSALATLLAPDESEEKGRRILSRALWEVRHALPEAAIATPGDSVRLHGTAVWRDCAEFDRLTAEALAAPDLTPDLARKLAGAVALFSADLLSDSYDDAFWLPREQRRERFLHTLERLAAWEKQQQRLARALDYTLTLTNADPLRESAHREALRLYAALNRPQAARRHYEQFCRTLQQELGVPPEPRTRQLAETILAQAATEPENVPWLPTPAPPVAWALSDTRRMPLIGREAERAQLITHLRQLSRGEGGIVFLSGPPGVGKSRLLEEMARDAEWRGIAVAQATGRDLARPAPWALFSEALTALLTPLRWQQLATLLDQWWLDLLAPLFPDVAKSAETVPAPAADHDRLEALVRLLLTLGKLSPLLLILDDLQWADSASLHGLVYLSQRLHDHPVLVMLGFRNSEARSSEAVWETLDTLDAGGLRLRLQLEPLTPAATDALIARGLGLTHAAPRFSARLHSETGGMPLLLLESLRTLHDEGALYRDEQGLWHTPWDEADDYAALHLPSAEMLLQRRLRQLAPVARHTLELAAVIGQEVHFSWLLAVTDQPRPDVLAALGLLVQRQFLHETPQAYRFSHDKIRQTLYEQIPTATRRHWHRLLAGVIAQERPDALALLVHHYERGEQWVEALHYALSAADQARELGAIPAALAGYATALTILDNHTPLEAESADLLSFRLLVQRQPLLLLHSQTERQQSELARLRNLGERLGDPACQAQALLREADFAAGVHSRHEHAISLAHQALQLADSHHLTRQQAEAWQAIGYSRYVQGRIQESITALRQAVALWEKVPDARQELMNASLKLIYGERAAGNTEAGLAQVERLLTLARGTGHLLRQATAWSARANFHSDEGEHLASIEANRQALEIFRRLGARLNEAKALGNLGYSYWALRDYGQAIGLTEESLALFEEAGTRQDLLLTWMNLAELYYDAGQLAQGEEYTAQGVALAQALGLTNYELMLQIGRIRALLGSERVAEAQALLEPVALRVVREEEWGLRAGLAVCRGLLHLLEGRPEAALPCFSEAVAGYNQQGNRDLVLAMQSHQAFALWQTGDQTGAAALSAGAIAALEQLPGGEFVAEMYWHHSQITGEPGTGRRWLARAHETVLAHARSLPDPADQRRFLERPLYRAIVRAWEGGQPRGVRVWLPPKGETTVGRKSADARIEISWTPWQPEDDALPDKVSRRRHQLRRLMAEAEAQGAQPIIPALAEALDSTIPTIKRDLAALRNAGF